MATENKAGVIYTWESQYARQVIQLFLPMEYDRLNLMQMIDSCFAQSNYPYL